MEGRRILIVEDDPFVAMHLEAILARTKPSDVIVSRTVAEAEAALGYEFDFAFLDVDVLDGTTYAFASKLSSESIPFAFVSASNREDVPLGLQAAPFVPKPYCDEDIIGLLKASRLVAADEADEFRGSDDPSPDAP